MGKCGNRCGGTKTENPAKPAAKKTGVAKTKAEPKKK